MGLIRLKHITLLAVSALIAGCAPPAENHSDESKPVDPVTEEQTLQTPLEGAVRHHLHATDIGEDFVIDVYVPPGTTEPLPVVYLTDGNMMFPMVLSTLRLLQFGNEVEPVILVGIGYKDAAQSMALRNRDLTPTLDEQFIAQAQESGPPVLPQAPPGGADAFLDFIRDQVKPLIAQNYPAKPDNDTLMGDSLGGLFTLHALFTRPQEYTRYVAGSPSIWWDDTVLFATEQAYADAHSDLAAELFISIGSLEQPEGTEAYGMVTNMHKMADTLEQRGYPSLQLTRYEFAGETHLSVIPATFSRGLRAVLGTTAQ